MRQGCKGCEYKSCGYYRGYIGIMEKKVEATIQGVGFRDITPIHGESVEKKIENKMETWRGSM